MTRTRTRRARRAGPIVLLACLVPPAGLGCQSVASKGARAAAKAAAIEAPAPALSAARAPAGAGPVKSDFAAEISAEKQVGLHLDLARLHEAAGRLDEAVGEYRRAVEVAGRSGKALKGGKRVPAEQQALAHRRLAGGLDRVGRFAESETHYKLAQKLAPHDAKVWNDTGYSYYLQARWVDAQKALKTAAKLAPSDPRIQTNLGLALAAGGQVDAALEALTRAGGPAAARANVGYILAATGKPDAAREQYRQALQYQPQFDTARVALARLDGGTLKGPQVAKPTIPVDPSLVRTSTTAKAAGGPGARAGGLGTRTPRNGRAQTADDRGQMTGGR